jgi:hypothetical protein
MPTARPATAGDVEAICAVCSTAYRETYGGLLPADYVERTIGDFYNLDRVRDEIAAHPPHWLGYQVVEERNRILGAAGGGVNAPRRR